MERDRRRALCEDRAVEEAASGAEARLGEARRRGSSPMFIQLATFRTETAIRAGDIGLAEEYAEQTLELGRELGAEHVRALWRPIVLLERGRPGEARELLESLDLTTRDPICSKHGPCAHRGSVRIACGELKRGVSDLLEADRRMRAAGLATSTLMLDWTARRRVGRWRRSAEATRRRSSPRARSVTAVAFGSSRRQGSLCRLCGALRAGRGGPGLAPRGGRGCSRARRPGWSTGALW